MPVNLSFSGLASGAWYLGQVVYNDGMSDIGTTIVNFSRAQLGSALPRADASWPFLFMLATAVQTA
jgi:hypothetical protein